MWLSMCRLNVTQPNSGTYALVLFLSEDKNIRIGRLGSIHFPSGYYVYVGSALRNLSSRIQRHLALAKKIHWHIDYLRAEATVVGVFCIRQPIRYECALAEEIARIADDRIPHFGSSDCRCKTHLSYFRENPIGFFQSLTDGLACKLQFANSSRFFLM
jgi:sugar fermentation stimulation protein A